MNEPSEAITFTRLKLRQFNLDIRVVPTWSSTYGFSLKACFIHTDLAQIGQEYNELHPPPHKSFFDISIIQESNEHVASYGLDLLGDYAMTDRDRLLTVASVLFATFATPTWAQMQNYQQQIQRQQEYQQQLYQQQQAQQRAQQQAQQQQQYQQQQYQQQQAERLRQQYQQEQSEHNAQLRARQEALQRESAQIDQRNRRLDTAIGVMKPVDKALGVAGGAAAAGAGCLASAAGGCAPGAVEAYEMYDAYRTVVPIIIR